MARIFGSKGRVSKGARGVVDVYLDGSLRGWFDARESGDNKCRLVIDDEYRFPVQARDYRDDLKRAGIRGGYAGFVFALPCWMLDNEVHSVSLTDEAGNQVAHTYLVFEKTPAILELEGSLLSQDVSPRESGRDGILAIFCGYSSDGSVNENHRATIALLRRNGCEVMFCLAVDAPLHSHESVIKSLGADHYLIKKNIGYDFGSWAAAYLCYSRARRDFPSRVVLVNDSIIHTGGTLEASFLGVGSTLDGFDVLAATDSFQHIYHLQSFWMVYKGEALSRHLLDQFLLYRGGIPSDKNEVISKYELSTHKFFAENGVSVRPILPYEDLVGLTIQHLKGEIDAIRRSSEYVENHPHSSALLHRVFNLLDAIRCGTVLNPAHSAWLAIAESGFPFVKREILTKNPASVPFLDLIRHVFERDDGVWILRDALCRISNPIFPPPQIFESRQFASCSMKERVSQ